MFQELSQTAIFITVNEANPYRAATAYVATVDSNGRIRRTRFSVDRVDDLVASIEASGVAVERTDYFRRIEFSIKRPRPAYVAPAMTEADRNWLAQQERAAATVRSATGRGARASFSNRLALRRGRR